MIYKVSTQDLVVLVNKEKLSLEEVEARTGMSRQGIWKRLKRAGVLVPRRANGGAPSKVVKFSCGFCGEPVQRYRKRAMTTDQMKAFCNMECYSASLAQHPYEAWRQGCRLARVVVSQHFPLQHEHIVHHKDGDNRNNDLSNLMVFACNADHMAHHRGRKVIALFDGATVTRSKSITHEP